MRLAEFIRKAMELRLSDVRVAMPVEVTAYDLDAQTVNVKPLIKNLVEAEDGVALESLPVLTSVPVAFHQGGGFFMSLPLVPGDTGELIVCDRSIDQWFKRGGEVEALDRRLHSFAGATFHPCLTDSKHPIADAHADNLVIGKDKGAQIHVKPDEVDLYEENAADFVALAQKCLTELQAVQTDQTTLKALLVTHVHSGVTVGTGATLASPAFATYTPHTPASVAATKVKAT